MWAAADPESEGELLVANSTGDDLFAAPVVESTCFCQVFGPLLGDLTAMGVETLRRQLVFTADFQVRSVHRAHFWGWFVGSGPEPTDQQGEQELHGATREAEGRHGGF